MDCKERYTLHSDSGKPLLEIGSGTRFVGLRVTDADSGINEFFLTHKEASLLGNVLLEFAQLQNAESENSKR